MIFRLILLMVLLGVFCRDAKSVTAQVGALRVGTITAPVISPAPNLDDVTNLTIGGIYYAPLALYMPSAATYTTNTTATLSDSWTNNWPLTNLAAVSKWPVRQAGALNGMDTLLNSVASGTYLQSSTFTSTPSFELVMVMRWAGPTNNATRYAFDCASSTSYRRYAGQDSSGTFTVNGDAGRDFSPNTNQWMVWDFIFDNGCIYGYTNNHSISGSSGGGATSMGGLTLGASYARSSCSPIETALVVAYGATNGLAVVPGTNFTARNRVYSNLASFFNLNLPSPSGTVLCDNTGPYQRSAVRVPHQRKAFYGKGRWWVFYSVVDAVGTGSGPYNYYYVSSADNGNIWSAPTLLGTVPTYDASWCLRYDSITEKLHLIRCITKSTLVYNGLEYRRGTPAADGTISWDTANWSTVWPTNNYIADPAIEVDSVGQPWVSCGYLTNGSSATTVDAAVNKNSATDGTWVDASGFPVSVTSSADGRYGLLSALTNGMGVIVYRFATITNKADCYVFTNGDNTFSSEGTITDTNLNAVKNEFAGVGRISCASAGDTLWLAYQDTNFVLHAKSRIGGVWGSETVLASDLNTESSPEIGFNGSEVIVVWGDSPSGQIRWCYYNGSWSAVQSYSGDTIAAEYEHVLIPQECNGTSMLLEWLTATYETSVHVTTYR